MPISAVIIARNEARTIGQCIAAAKKICAEVLVLENGSTDATAQIARDAGATVVECTWQGYGGTKNHGHLLALHPWILSLDSDEYIDDELGSAIAQLDLSNQNIVGCISRYLVWEGKILKHGLGREKKLRLFHRDAALWNDALVHEALICKSNTTILNLPGRLIHDAYDDKEAAKDRIQAYARLWAMQKYADGKRAKPSEAGWRGTVSLLIQILRGAWLDGAAGISFAREMASYTKSKYAQLADYSKGNT
jgi:glycosyltransferase involved in cell wall biosynthesis